MPQRSRARYLLVLGILVSLAVVSGAGAWACVPQPLISLQPRSSGPAGSAITVAGVEVAGSGEIRWNAVDGPELARVSGPSFSVPITVPPSVPGLYTVVFLTRENNGAIAATARAAFLVTTEPPETPAPPGEAASPPRSISTGTKLGFAAFGGALVIVGVVAGVGLSRRWQSRLEDREADQFRRA